jgi:4a-hydroxytetrahydrobiopterin dehydratase
MSDLATKHCKPCEGGLEPLGLEAARKLIAKLDHWTLDPSGKEIQKLFNFRNYHETMAFVNASAWISHREDHHPDLEVGYNLCRVRYTTHAIGGLSENDFICAAKIDALLSTT